jgi:hypothetical protein
VSITGLDYTPAQNYTLGDYFRVRVVHSHAAVHRWPLDTVSHWSICVRVRDKQENRYQPPQWRFDMRDGFRQDHEERHAVGPLQSCPPRWTLRVAAGVAQTGLLEAKIVLDDAGFSGVKHVDIVVLLDSLGGMELEPLPAFESTQAPCGQSAPASGPAPPLTPHTAAPQAIPACRIGVWRVVTTGATSPPALTSNERAPRSTDRLSESWLALGHSRDYMAKLAYAFGCGAGAAGGDNPNSSRILAVKLSHTNEKQHLITIGSRSLRASARGDSPG